MILYGMFMVVHPGLVPILVTGTEAAGIIGVTTIAVTDTGRETGTETGTGREIGRGRGTETETERRWVLLARILCSTIIFAFVSFRGGEIVRRRKTGPDTKGTGTS